MASSNMDIDYKSEERYARISIAYKTNEEYAQVNKALEEAHKGYDLDENIYITDISNGRKVLVVEYHDDYDRESGTIFETLMKKLDITTCI